jgi:rhamnulokinase
VDTNDARFLNPPDMPTAFREFCRETSQPAPDSKGALIRCALESLALKYSTVLECLEEINGRRVEVIHIVGGGSRNELLNQLTADACNRVVVTGPVEATAMGNILLQARACGEISSLAELREVVRDSSEVTMYEPRESQMKAWREAREKFTKILGAREGMKK